MAETRRKTHDRSDPRGGRTIPTGPQGKAEQAKWQSSKSGEAAVKEAHGQRNPR